MHPATPANDNPRVSRLGLGNPLVPEWLCLRALLWPECSEAMSTRPRSMSATPCAPCSSPFVLTVDFAVSLKQRFVLMRTIAIHGRWGTSKVGSLKRINGVAASVGG